MAKKTKIRFGHAYGVAVSYKNKFKGFFFDWFEERLLSKVKKKRYKIIGRPFKVKKTYHDNRNQKDSNKGQRHTHHKPHQKGKVAGY